MSQPPPSDRLRRLWPPGPDVTPSEFVAGLGFDARGPVASAGPAHSPSVRAAGSGRPRVLLNMVCSADGRAEVGGRTATLSGPGDRALFHALRARVDGVMVGAGTARDESYGRMIRDPDVRGQRERDGLTPEPWACIVSASVALPPELPLLREPQARVVIVTAGDGMLATPSAAHVDYVRASTPAGAVDLVAALAELRRRFDVDVLLVEGGPHLNGSLLSSGLVDDLLLTVSPMLASGPDPLTITAGPPLPALAGLELTYVLGQDSYLFLGYQLRDDER
jgi:riboflavin biosynthesis pyrimidine reductase